MNQKPFSIFGNWKSNKTVSQAEEWIQDFARLWVENKLTSEHLKVGLAVSSLHVAPLRAAINSNKIPLSLGVQTISPFGIGAYTGEIAAAQLTGTVDFTLIGHSERRTHFHEAETDLAARIKEATQAHLTTIYCVQNGEMKIPEAVNIVAYEPVWAIGTGQAESPENADQVAHQLLETSGREITILYGGSVSENNIAAFTATKYISGVLVGGASLDPQKFIALIQNATQS